MEALGNGAGLDPGAAEGYTRSHEKPVAREHRVRRSLPVGRLLHEPSSPCSVLHCLTVTESDRPTLGCTWTALP